MTFLDAYALIEYLVGGPAAEEVRALLREGDAAVATVNLAETLDVCERTYGVPIARAMGFLEPLFDGSLAPVPLDASTAANAAVLRARHYHRATCPLSLADSVLLAAASPGHRIATADPDVLAVARIEAVATVSLSDQG